MKRLWIIGAALCVALFISTSAFADDDTPRHRTGGMVFDVGAPDGVAAGLVVRPVIDWARLEGAITYNAMAPGIRGGFTLDPIDFGVAPTFTFEGGHAWNGKVPGMTNPIGVQYNYANLHLGLEFGNRNAWRIFLRGGMSYLDLQTSNFTGAVTVGNGITLSNPTFDGWVPSGKLGFSIYF